MDYVTGRMGLSYTAKRYFMECKGRNPINQSKTCLKIQCYSVLSCTLAPIARVMNTKPTGESHTIATLGLLF